MAQTTTHVVRPAAGIAVMVSGMVILASSDAMAKHLTVEIAVVQILWVRYVIFATMGTVMVMRRPREGRFDAKRPVLQVARALLLNLANFLFVTSLSLMSLAEAHSVMAVAPLLVTAVSAPLLGELVGPRRWAAVAIGFSGMIIILRPGIGVFDPASLVPLAAAVCFALYTVLTKIISRTDSQEVTLCYTGVIGLLSLSLIVPFFWTRPEATDWFWLTAAGLTGTLAHVCIVAALHLAPASMLQPFNYTMLVWATVLGFLVFDNLPDLWTTIGAMVIVCSGLYAWHRERLVFAGRSR